MVNDSIRLLFQYLAGPDAEPLTGLDCTGYDFDTLDISDTWRRASEQR